MAPSLNNVRPGPLRYLTAPYPIYGLDWLSSPPSPSDGPVLSSNDPSSSYALDGILIYSGGGGAARTGVGNGVRLTGTTNTRAGRVACDLDMDTGLRVASCVRLLDVGGLYQEMYAGAYGAVVFACGIARGVAVYCHVVTGLDAAEGGARYRDGERCAHTFLLGSAEIGDGEGDRNVECLDFGEPVAGEMDARLRVPLVAGLEDGSVRCLALVGVGDAVRDCIALVAGLGEVLTERPFVRFDLLGDLPEVHEKAICKVSLRPAGGGDGEPPRHLEGLSCSKDGTFAVHRFPLQHGDGVPDARMLFKTAVELPQLGDATTQKKPMNDRQKRMQAKARQVLVRGAVFSHENKHGPAIVTVASRTRGGAFLCRWERHAPHPTTDADGEPDGGTMPSFVAASHAGLGRADLLCFAAPDGALSRPFAPPVWRERRQYLDLHDEQRGGRRDHHAARAQVHGAARFSSRGCVRTSVALPIGRGRLQPLSLSPPLREECQERGAQPGDRGRRHRVSGQVSRAMYPRQGARVGVQAGA